MQESGGQHTAIPKLSNPLDLVIVAPSHLYARIPPLALERDPVPLLLTPHTASAAGMVIRRPPGRIIEGLEGFGAETKEPVLP